MQALERPTGRSREGTLRFLLLLVVALLVARPVAACGTLEVQGATWKEVDGKVFGCVPDEVGPVGGGGGYNQSVVTGDFSVVSIEQLIDTLGKARAGDTVYIPGGVVLDFTALVKAERFILKIPAGVTLASNRGVGQSAGALLKSDAMRTSPLIRAEGAGVRLTGLRIIGPDPQRRVQHWRESFESQYEDKRGGLTQRQYYYSLPTSTGVYSAYPRLEVDNCELAGWSRAALFLARGEGHHVHDNYIHSNQRQGLGYGVAHDIAFSVIEYNKFARNRHSIAGTGRPPSGYVARHNVEHGLSLSHNFDMHGGRGRRDGTGPQVLGSRSTTTPFWARDEPSAFAADRMIMHGSREIGSSDTASPGRPCSALGRLRIRSRLRTTSTGPTARS